MKLVDAIDMAEAALERGLRPDEIVLVARLCDAGKDAADIPKVLDTEVEVKDDGEERVHRFEAHGRDVRRIT